MTALAITVPGVPAPQGSMKSLGPGRLVHSNPQALLPWRASVIAHVRQQMTGQGWPIDGPVKVGITFHLPRPKSAPKSRMWPDKKPDIDKLARAALDSLEQAGAIYSDAQVVMLGCTKAYGTPGMTLTLRSLSVASERAA